MPDYGDPSNARSWTNANVYIGFASSGVYPTTPSTISTAFGSGWELVGLLDGGQGFSEQTTETVTDTFAWGQILIASRVSDQKTTKTFTAYEANEVTDRLRGISGGVQYRQAAERVKIAFEAEDTARGVVERYISSFEAEVRINGDLTQNETTPQSFPFIATIFPGSALELWDIQRSVAASS
jgi:hypothetical protein